MVIQQYKQIGSTFRLIKSLGGFFLNIKTLFVPELSLDSLPKGAKQCLHKEKISSPVLICFLNLSIAIVAGILFVHFETNFSSLI